MRFGVVALAAALAVACVRADQAVLDAADLAKAAASPGEPMPVIEGEAMPENTKTALAGAQDFYERLRETSGRAASMVNSQSEAQWCGQPWWCRRLWVYRHYRVHAKRYKKYTDDLKNRIKTLNKETLNLQDKTAKAKKALAASQSQIVRVRMVGETLEGVYRGAMEMLNAEKARRTKLANEAARVVARARGANIIKNSLNVTIHKLEEEIVRLEHEAEINEKKTDELADQTTTELEESGKVQGAAAAKRIELTLDIDEDADAIKTSAQRLAALQDTLLETQQRRNETRASAEAAKAEYERLVHAQESAEMEAQTLEMKITSLEGKYATAADAKRQAMEVASNTAREQQDAEDEDRKANMVADSLAEEQTFVERVLSENKLAAADTDAEMATLNARRQELMHEIGKLSNATSALRERKDRLADVHDELKANATAIQEELVRVRSELAEQVVREKEEEAAAEQHRARADKDALAGKQAHKEALGFAAASTVRRAKHIETMAEGLMGFCDCAEDEGACSKCGPHVKGAGADTVADTVAAAESIREGAQDALEKAKLAVSPSSSPSPSSTPSPSASVSVSASASPSASSIPSASPTPSASASASAAPSSSASPSAPAASPEAPADEEHADEEHADEEHADEEHADEEHADEEHADEEHADEEHADEEHADEEHADEEHADEEHADEEHADEEHADEEHADEEHADEEHADEEHADEEHADEEHADEEHADEHADEEHADEGESDEEIAERFAQLMNSRELEAADAMRFRETRGKALRGGAEADAEAKDDPLDHVPKEDKALFTPPKRWRNWPWAWWCIWRHKWCRYENYAWNLLRHFAHVWWHGRHSLWWRRNRAQYQQRRATQYFNTADSAAKAAKAELDGIVAVNTALKESTKQATERKDAIVKQMKRIDEQMQEAYKGLGAAQGQVERFRFEVEDLKEERMAEQRTVERTEANMNKAEEIQVRASEDLAASRAAALKQETSLRNQLGELEGRLRKQMALVSDLELKLEGVTSELQSAQSARDLAEAEEREAKREAESTFKIRDERQMSRAKVEEQIKAAKGMSERAKAATAASEAAIAAAKQSLEATKSEMRKLRAKLERTKAAMHAAGSAHALSAGDQSSVGIAVRKLQDAVSAKESETEALQGQLARMAEEAAVFSEQMQRASTTKASLQQEVDEAKSRASAAGAVARKEEHDADLATAERDARSSERDELARARGLMARTPLERMSEMLKQRRALEAKMGGERAEAAAKHLDESDGEAGRMAKMLAEQERAAEDALMAGVAKPSMSMAAEEDAVEAEADSLVGAEGAEKDNAALEDLAESVTVSPEDLPADSASGDRQLDDMMGMGRALSAAEQAEEEKAANPGSSGEGEAAPAAEDTASTGPGDLAAAADSSGDSSQESQDASSDLEDAAGIEEE